MFRLFAQRAGRVDLVGVGHIESERLDRNLEALLHRGVVQGEVAREAAVLERHPIGILEVDRFRPSVVDHVGHLHSLVDQFPALVFERRRRPGLEGEMIKGRRRAEAAIDAGVVLDRNSRNPAWLHEGQQLIAAGIKEDVADGSAFLDLDRVGDHHLEAQHLLVKLTGPVQVKCGKADMGESFMTHDYHSLRKEMDNSVSQRSRWQGQTASGLQIWAAPPSTKLGAGDESAVIGGEENRSPGDFIRCTEAAHRDTVYEYSPTSADLLPRTAPVGQSHLLEIMYPSIASPAETQLAKASS